MKREHKQKALNLMILYCIMTLPQFGFAQSGNESPPLPPEEERLPNDEYERCYGEIVPWGALEVIISP